MTVRRNELGYDPDARTNPAGGVMTDGEYWAHIDKIVDQAPPLPRKVIEVLRASRAERLRRAALEATS